MTVEYKYLKPHEVLQRIKEKPIAYLSLGTIEWHGKHLPVGSDLLQSEGFLIKLAERVGGIVYPPLFLGPDIKEINGDKEYYGMDILGNEKGNPKQLTGSSYHVENDLYISMIEAILKQMKRVGFKIVVAHGHGPSTYDFKINIDRWEKEYGMKMLVCWREDESDGMGIMTDHAAANETSIMMSLYNDLVDIELLKNPDDDNPLLAIGGKDPREFASKELGDKIIADRLDEFEKIINDLL